MQSSRLDEIVDNSYREVAERKQKVTLATLERKATRTTGKFLAAISDRAKISLIAEIKPKSPSAGVLQTNFSLDSVLDAYNKHASAISVLTDEKYFGGSLDLLRETSRNSQLPTLCKDFILDTYQCFEARTYGADAVLLIVKILAPSQLANLYETIESLGMTPIVEVQTEKEMDLALALKPSVVLINNRNLNTFETDLKTTGRLSIYVPSDTILISASGIESRADIELLSRYVSTFLIGSSLMRAPNIGDKLVELASARPRSGRAAR
jgi:indole-3-glycerol phosphate synthase